MIYYKLDTAVEIGGQLLTQLSKMREEINQHHSCNSNAVEDCISEYFSGSALSEHQQNEQYFVVQNTVLFFTTLDIGSVCNSVSQREFFNCTGGPSNLKFIMDGFV